MSQGQDYGALFEASQLCKTSGNSAECFNAIDTYAKSYNQNQQANPRTIQMDTDDETRFGYDLNVIDHKLIAGQSQKQKGMNSRDPNNPMEMIKIEGPKIRKEEEPSLHQTKSVHFHQAFHLSSDFQGQQRGGAGADGNILTSGTSETSGTAGAGGMETHTPAEGQVTAAIRAHIAKLSMLEERGDGRKQRNYDNISDIDKETYAFLLFIGILVPVMFIFLIVIIENFKK